MIIKLTAVGPPPNSRIRASPTAYSLPGPISYLPTRGKCNCEFCIDYDLVFEILFCAHMNVSLNNSCTCF